jgi:hypothetical protein
MVFILNKTNYKHLENEIKAKETEKEKEEVRKSAARPDSRHMSGEFGEIDLASDMNMQTIPINEDGEEPFIGGELDLFTEDDVDSERSTFIEDRDGIEKVDPFGALLLDIIVEKRPRPKTTVQDRSEKQF